MFLLFGTVDISCRQTSHPELGSATSTLDVHSTAEIPPVRRVGKVWLAGKKLEAERKARPVRLRQEWEA